MTPSPDITPPPFIDIHYHGPLSIPGKTAVPEEILRVQSLLLSAAPAQETPPGNLLFTAGIHPKNAATPWNSELFTTLWNSENCIAIGECGLDRRFPGFATGEQKTAFLRQAETAERLRLPLVIHAVRAGDEIRRLRRDQRATVPWILHSFRGNVRKAEEFIASGFLLSFGAGLLRDAVRLKDLFRNIPVEKLFFETDESGEDIRKIYALAASMLSMGTDELKRLVFQNFKQVFRKA